MALLPGEMFAQRGKKIKMTVGVPISWQSLDDGRPAKLWAQELHDTIYTIN